MNPDIKRAWVEALRSGRYKKHTGSLSCLGVLCQLAQNNRAIVSYGFNNSSLPEEVSTWCGLDTQYPVVETGEQTTQAIAFLNDCGLSFYEIADLIESQL